MARGAVVVYFSQFGGPRESQENVRSTIVSIAKQIAEFKEYEYVGCRNNAHPNFEHTYFVPNDTIISEEASELGICSKNDLFGGVVPRLFMKTKAVVHDLVGERAERPDGWCDGLAKQLRSIVLPGYTAFNVRDARTAARWLLPSGAIRAKSPLGSGGLGQTVIRTIRELDDLLEQSSDNDLATYGLVIELNLHQVTTLNIGQVTIDRAMVSYYGTQRMTSNNEGIVEYGGSDLVCVRGGWDALDKLQIAPEIRIGLDRARAFDQAVHSCSGFIASRRNYDVGIGVDESGQRQTGVFEATWRWGAASTSELAALAEFARNPRICIVEVSNVKKFGKDHKCPPGAAIHYQGDDSLAGPMIRYTLVTRTMIDNST